MQMDSHASGGADGRFMNAIEAIYETAVAPERWPHALQAIADVFGDVGSVLTYRRDDGRFGVIVSPTLEAGQEEYNRYWHRYDIRAQRGVERGIFLTHEAVTDRELGLQEELETHPFYTQFLRKLGLRWFASVGISPDPHVFAALSVQRAASKPPFSPQECEMLARLGRHAERSLRLGIRLMESESANAGLRETFNRLGMGLYMLDELGRVVFSNATADRLLGQGLEIDNGRLIAGPDADRAALQDVIAANLRAAPDDLAANPKPLLVQLPHRGSPLAIYVLPLRGSLSPAVEQFMVRARLIVLAIEVKPGAPADPSLVRDLLGLTLGEARVAALVAAGLGPRQASEKLGIAEETTRTVLKRVFSKTGISRQSELAALLSRLIVR